MKKLAARADHVIVALDVQSYEDAVTMVRRLRPAVKIFKVGMELFTAAGPRVIEMVRGEGAEVFLDLKFHDIPNTVAGAVRSASELGVFLCNVHATGGRRMMEEAAHSALAAKNGMRVIAVTVLTSMGDEDLKQVGVLTKPEDQVLALAQLAKDSGLHGVVCSGQEAKAVRNLCGKDFWIVTPGVRPAWAAKGDQTRIVTPRDAFEAGANYIVVGRPVTAASDPREAAEKLMKEL